ncbi:hypothetical protein FRC12_002850 [Ceratobasidium sp. 428]|nr:hypothetical protein FRC12_002850 [Ceratobasidium sp. 428]
MAPIPASPRRSPRRSTIHQLPRRSTIHQSLSPRRSPRKSTLHEFVAQRSGTPDIEVEFHIYQYHVLEAAAVQAALSEATRHLALPRETPGQSQHDSVANSPQPGTSQSQHNGVASASQPGAMEVDSAPPNNEPALADLQNDQDKILEALYQGADGNGNVDMQLISRLMARMIQKQDTLQRSLQGIKESARTTEGNSALPPNPNSGLPRRPFPPEPPVEENWDQSLPYDEPAGRQSRAPRRVLISSIIRKNLLQLLKRANKQTALPPPPPAEIQYPTEENFGIRYDEMEKSIFNRLAAEVVFKRVCKTWEGDALTKEEIADLPGQCKEHIRHLCRTWKKAQREDAEALKKIELKKASAASRRATLYESRLRVIGKFPRALKKHRKLLTRLGVAGTSSDEEDPVIKGQYNINRRPEFSTHVQVIKSKIDLVDSLWCHGPGSKGSCMRNRVPSDNVSTRSLRVEDVQGLPITCMSGAWLREVPAAHRELYRFVPHRYDPSFPDDLLKRGVGRDPYAIILSDDEDEKMMGDNQTS